MESALQVTDIIFLSYIIFWTISSKSISTIENTGRAYYVVNMPEGKRLAKDSFMETCLQKMLNGIFEKSQDLSEI